MSVDLTGLRVAFAGSGAFGVPALRALNSAGAELAAVYTQPDKPAGRGKKVTPTPIAAAAGELGIEAIRTPRLNDEDVPDVDCLVVIAFGQKIGQALTEQPRLGAFNLHASLLPRWRGAAPIHHAVIAGDKLIGNSIIRLADRMDAGAVLVQSRNVLGDGDTTGDLHDRLAELGGPLVVQTLRQLADNRVTETPQDEAMATPAPKLSRADAVIDWTAGGLLASRRINGLSPWPGCRVRIGDDQATLVRAFPSTIPGEPGLLTADGTVGCGDTSVEILELQPPGKKPMDLKSYRNGRPWAPGTKIESVT